MMAIAPFNRKEMARAIENSDYPIPVMMDPTIGSERVKCGEIERGQIRLDEGKLFCDWKHPEVKITGFHVHEGKILEANALPLPAPIEVDPLEPIPDAALPEDMRTAPSEELEEKARLVATSVGTVVDLMIGKEAVYFLLVEPLDGGGMSFTTNVAMDQMAMAMRQWADKFEKQMARRKAPVLDADGRPIL